MKIVTIGSTKGGVGKSTLAAALAVRACKDYNRVAIVDLDAQQSLVDWCKKRPDKKAPEVFGGEFDPAEAVKKLELSGWDIAFLDTPPSFLDIIGEAAAVSDLMVIPLRPSMIDLKSTVAAVLHAKAAQVPVLCVFNDVIANDGEATLNGCRAVIERSQIPVSATVIYHRVAHINGFGAGQTAAEYKTKDPKAAAEINALWLDIKSRLESTK